jgi:uncharacterized membrane-anchored protein
LKTKILMGCVALQAGVLAWMAGEREWVRQTGRTVYFRTAPVDPRDVMRGDYVRLNYPMSAVSRDQCRGSLQDSTNFAAIKRDQRVYTSLREDADGLVHLTSLGADRPRDGMYIRGRTTSSSPFDVQVRYGLEAWFLEQGSGKKMEIGPGRDGIQVPLEMQAALSPGGLAVLKDYRWCPMGIGLTLVTTNRNDTNRTFDTRLVSGTVQLLNASSNDLAVVDLPGGGSLAMESVNTWDADRWQWTSPAPGTPASGQPRVIVLKPGEVHGIPIDFEDPRWSVSKHSRPSEVKRLTELRQDWSTRFRFVYRSPDGVFSTNLPNANLVWQGELRTRAFAPAGGAID